MERTQFGQKGKEQLDAVGVDEHWPVHPYGHIG